MLVTLDEPTQDEPHPLVQDDPQPHVETTAVLVVLQPDEHDAPHVVESVGSGLILVAPLTQPPTHTSPDRKSVV